MEQAMEQAIVHMNIASPVVVLAEAELVEDGVAGHYLTSRIADNGAITLRLARPDEARVPGTGLVLTHPAKAGTMCRIFSNGTAQPEDVNGA